jgi:hypothetical protein
MHPQRSPVFAPSPPAGEGGGEGPARRREVFRKIKVKSAYGALWISAVSYQFNSIFNHPKEISMHHTTTEHTALATAADVQLTDAERQPCEVWTRVMGYHRPVASFNIGKQGEHNERQFFAEK